MIISGLLGCHSKTNDMQYQVTKITELSILENDWDMPPWDTIEPVTLTNYMGEKPAHFPYTQAKVAYDDEAIYVKFRVEDQFIKAVTNENQGDVYKDSCVEFFFTPGTDVEKGYFNLEMNCGGTMLFHHQVEPRKNAVVITADDIRQIKVVASLPKQVDPEITEKKTWMVSYRIPFSVLHKYHDFKDPQPGTTWRANFYKCADGTSHPHWLTWASVDRPSPDFHRPEYFGELKF
jgi:hypothetical protein